MKNNTPQPINAGPAMTSILILPPDKQFKRPRRFKTFARTFRPIERADGSLIWEPDEVPADADSRNWWTVLDPSTGTLYLAAGFHLINRIGYVRCINGWAGHSNDHPEYIYATDAEMQR